MIAFEEFDGDEEDLTPEIQYIKCHKILYVKMGGIFGARLGWLLVVT